MKSVLVLGLLTLCQCATPLEVESIPEGGRILINGVDTGHRTPSTFAAEHLKRYGNDYPFKVQVILGTKRSPVLSATTEVDVRRIIGTVLIPPLLIPNLINGYKNVYPGRMVMDFTGTPENFDGELLQKNVENGRFQNLLEKLATSPPEGQQTTTPNNTLSDGRGVSGTITLTCNVEAAEILVDGVLVGNAPAKLRLPPGNHLVEVRKDGYISYKREMRVLADSDVSLVAELRK